MNYNDLNYSIQIPTTRIWEKIAYNNLSPKTMYVFLKITFNKECVCEFILLHKCKYLSVSLFYMFACKWTPSYMFVTYLVLYQLIIRIRNGHKLSAI